MQNYTTPNISISSVDDQSQRLLTCRAQRCNNYGDCVILDGVQVCKCMLGYTGETCTETVNNGIAVPLTLGVLGVIVAFIFLLFVLAFVQQRRRERSWDKVNKEREALNENVSHT